MRVRLKLDRLHDLIARSNLSQNHWAIKLGLSRGHWSDIVNGKHPYPSGRTRERIIEVFGVSFEELFEAETGGWSDQHFQAAISDRYLIDRELGHGGMGTVYLARDVKLGRQVAIKVVSPEAVSGIGIKQFLKEIRNTARLEHHHILPLHDAGEAAGYPYYVMPYIRAGSLRDMLDRVGRLSVAEAIRIGRGITAALQYAHERHILHCDVKPANILVSDGHAFVADFGISRAIHTEAFEWGRPAGLDSSAGTPAYVSPEQASGEQRLDARSDVYSLACLVFEMLSGEPPFRGTTTVATVAQRFTGEIPDLRTAVPGIPLRISTAVKRGMSLDIARRHQSARDFLASLERGFSHVSLARERASLALSRASDRLLRSIQRPGSVARPARRSPLFVKGKTMIESTRQDVAYAFRAFTRTPLFTAVVVATLAFGIAGTALVFSLLNPYFIRPLPFGDADRLVQLGQVDPITGWDRYRFSLPQLRDYQQRSRAFDDLGAYYYGSRNLTGDDEPERVLVGYVTGNMFSILRVSPEIGRTLLPDESDVSAPEVAVLDHGLWQRRFGADPDIVGRSIWIDGVSRTVVGVMPREFVFPFGGIDLWLPIKTGFEDTPRDRMGSIIVGRLRPDWTIDLAREELSGVQRDLGMAYPDEDGRFDGVSVLPIRQALNFVWSVFQVMFAILMAAVGFALLIACANVASLMLARGTARRGEIAVRTALGAGRGRLVKQLLTESVILAAVGGGLGLIVTHFGSRLIGPLIPEDWYRVGEASVDGSVLLFAIGVTILTSLLFGLAPALNVTRTDLSAALKEGRMSGRGVKSMRARRALVVLQVAIAAVLLSGLGLAARSLQAVQGVDLGFNSDEVLTVSVNPPRATYNNADEIGIFYDRAFAEIEAVPGVRAVSSVARLPLNHELSVEGYSDPAQVPAELEDWSLGLMNQVSPGYFGVMDIPLVAGRDFTEADTEDSEAVVIVSQRLAGEPWLSGSPIGRTVLLGGEPEEQRLATIVGVVGDARFEGMTGEERPQIYSPIDSNRRRGRYVVIASDGTPSLLTGSVRRVFLNVDGNLPVTIRTMDDIVSENVLPWTISSVLLSVLGGGGVLLALLGLYGVIAYSVAQRQREIGVRMALGAAEGRIRAFFLREGLVLTAVGLVIGLAGAVVASRAVAAALFGIGPFDLVTFTGVVVVFGVVAALASLVPAVRASKLDAVEVLRYE
jgi:predicted permease